MSEAGVLHYFGSMDRLLVAVLEERDMETTTHEAGLTQLYVEMNIAAQDPAHPAAEFITRHRAQTVDLLAGLLGTADPARDAHSLVDAAEGLQLMWLIDRDTDIAGGLRYLCQSIARG